MAALTPHVRSSQGPLLGSSGRRAVRATVVQWDRLGRIAMLIVLIGLAYLYLGAIMSYVSTYRDAQRRDGVVTRLRHENATLRARRAALLRPSTLEHAARSLGMIRPTERPYIIENLPAH